MQRISGDCCEVVSQHGIAIGCLGHTFTVAGQQHQIALKISTCSMTDLSTVVEEAFTSWILNGANRVNRRQC